MFWDTSSSIETKRLSSHSTDIIGIVLIEDPISKNSYILSFGNHQDRFNLTNAKTGETKQMVLKDDVGVVGGKFTNPNMHLSIEKDNFNNQKLMLLACGQKGDDHFLIKVDLMGELGGVNGGGSSLGKNASFKKNEF